MVERRVPENIVIDSYSRHDHHEHRVQDDSDHYPGEMKHQGKSCVQSGWDTYLVFEQIATKDQKPGINLNRQPDAHQATHFGKEEWNDQNAHSQVMLFIMKGRQNILEASSNK